MAKKAKTKVVEAEPVKPKTFATIPHGIANLTQPSPAATDDELRDNPELVAAKQAQAEKQTAFGQRQITSEE